MIVKFNALFLKQIVVFLLILLISASARSDSGQDISFAYLEKGLTELKDNEKQIALQLMANELTRNTDLHISIKPVFTFAEMQDLIQKESIDYAILNSFHYLNHYGFFQQFISEPVWGVQRSEFELESYVIVAQKKYADKAIKSFSNKQLSSHQPYLLMNFYLDYWVNKSTGQQTQQFFKKIKYVKTASQAVLDVYFKSSDLCIVPKHIFDLTVDLNPAILKRLTIIHQSESLFSPVLTFTFKHVDPLIKQALNNNFVNFGQTPRSQQILEMFNFQAIKPITLKQLTPMYTLFKNHQALQ